MAWCYYFQDNCRRHKKYQIPIIIRTTEIIITIISKFPLSNLDKIELLSLELSINYLPENLC
jgi:hypothetical protein